MGRGAALGGTVPGSVPQSSGRRSAPRSAPAAVSRRAPGAPSRPGGIARSGSVRAGRRPRAGLRRARCGARPRFCRLSPFRRFVTIGTRVFGMRLKVRERRTKRRGAPRVGAAARGPAARLRAAGGRPGDRPRRWGRCGPAGAARGTGRTGRCCWEPPRASAAFLFVPAGPLSPAEGSGSQRSPWFCGSVEGLGEAERREPGGGLSRHGTDNSLEPVVVPG